MTNYGLNINSVQLSSRFEASTRQPRDSPLHYQKQSYKTHALSCSFIKTCIVILTVCAYIVAVVLLLSGDESTKSRRNLKMDKPPRRVIEWPSYTPPSLRAPLPTQQQMDESVQVMKAQEGSVDPPPPLFDSVTSRPPRPLPRAALLRGVIHEEALVKFENITQRHPIKL